MRLATLFLSLFLVPACGSAKPMPDTPVLEPQPATLDSSATKASESTASVAALPDKVVRYDDETEAALAPLLADAKATYPEARARYLAGLPGKHVFMLVTRLTDESGKWEQVFIRVTSVHNGLVKGTIANEINSVEGYAHGDSVEFAETRIRDWVIVRSDGSEEGNRVGRFLDYWRSGEFFGALFAVTRSSANEVSVRYMHMLDRHKKGAQAHFDPPSVFLSAALKELRARSWKDAEPDKEFYTYLLYWPLEPTNLNREP
ncbi:MAG: DUF2314 domain-containing protein [Kofleriaceae bacterium]|nr:DUF2314 domain-containing protein [Kofleriaceae bacterium]